jgi:hypothetical protein
MPFRCEPCDREFPRQMGLSIHNARAHSNGAVKQAKTKTPPPDSESDAHECECCAEPAVARLVTSFLNWPLCEGHLLACVSFIEPV